MFNKLKQFLFGLPTVSYRSTGYIKPISPTGRPLLEAAPTTIPPSYITNITPFKLPQNIFMQAQQPSCVAHAVTWALMYKYWKKTGKYVKLSPRFLYALCKANDGVPNTPGTYLEVALTMAEKYGVCEDLYFPNNVNLSSGDYQNVNLIPPAAYANALNYKLDPLKTRFLGDHSSQGLSSGIYQNDIVIIGMDISDYWWTDGKGNATWSSSILNPLKPIDAQNPVVSGHAICLYAYGAPWNAQNPSETWLMNWWSNAWNYNGRGCFGGNDIPNIYEAAVVGI